MKKLGRSKKQNKALLKSDLLTEPTKEALRERLKKTGSNQFFDDEEYRILSRVCDLLIDQDSNNQDVDVAFFIDERLAKNITDGWRYDVLPPDREKYKLGIGGINESSKFRYSKSFNDLEEEQQIDVLNKVQSKTAWGEVWKELDSKLFFEDLLAETSEIFFSNPIIQASINYVGMADAQGWNKIKLNESEGAERLDIYHID